MKKLLFLVFSFSGICATAQVDKRVNLEVSASFKLGSTKVTEIGKDSVATYGSGSKLITERAAKAYARSVGGSGISGAGINNELTYWTSTNSLGSLSIATYPSLTELSYVKGLTSIAQTQFDSKVGITGTQTVTGNKSFTGRINLPSRTNTSARDIAMDGNNVTFQDSTNAQRYLGSSKVKSIVEARCVIRSSVDGSGNITWAFINDSDHQPVFFDSVYTDGAGRLTIRYPTITKAIYFNVSHDESFAKIPMQMGASVGLSTSTIWMFRHAVFGFSLIGNGTSTYSYNSVPPSIAKNAGDPESAFSFSYDSTSGVVSFNNIPYQDPDNEPYSLGIEYEGASNYRVQRIWSGLSYRQMKFKLVDAVTNTTITGAPTATTRIIVRGPIIMTEIPACCSSPAPNRDYPGFIFRSGVGSYLPNFWITATFIE